MKIRVVGGGWYGCHIACELLDDGHDVTLYEARSALFSGASGANQSRLHLGFHYPRDYRTRIEAIEGFRQFMTAYGECTREIPCNVYAVANDRSLVDFETYRAVMAADGIEFITLEYGDHGLDDVEGAVLTGERLILQANARRMFERRLAGRIRLGTPVTDLAGTTYHATVNCTHGALPAPMVHRYEPCVMFLFEGPDNRAVTIMDGPFGASMYPWIETGQISLTSVAHTPMGAVKTYAEAEAVMKAQDGAALFARRDEMIAFIRHHVPWFLDAFTPTGHAFSIRALPASMADRRTSVVAFEGDVISVLPGKISGIFAAAAAVKEALECLPSASQAQKPLSLVH